MKLSELTRIKELVDQLDPSEKIEQLINELDGIISTANYEITAEYISVLREQRDQTQKTLLNFVSTLQNLKSSMVQRLCDGDQNYKVDDETRWNDFKNDPSFTIMRRRITVDPISEILLKERLLNKVSWQHPGLIFRPIHAMHLDRLVAADPMYWVDTDQDLIDEASKLFTEEYNRRLCKYVLPDYDKVDLSRLPTAQFGFVYAVEFFNYKSMTVIEQYLKQIFDLLKPGGCFVFTYTDCDTHAGSLRFERYGSCYTSQRLLTKMINDIGFQIDYTYSDAGGFSWIEISKPGTLTSIKAGQVLAKIQRINGPAAVSKLPVLVEPNIESPKMFDNTVDNPKEDVYTEVSLLIEIATMLGLDLNMSLSKGQPHPKKLRKMIATHFNSEKFPVEKINRLLEKRKPQ